MSTAKKLSVTTLRMTAVLLVAMAWSTFARADVFDDQTPNDDDMTLSENELVHKTVQIHDLAAKAGVADVDHYPITIKPYSSYEVIVDQTSADIAPAILERIDNVGIPVQSSIGTSALGYTRTLRWENTTAFTLTHYIRVKSGLCTTTCGKSAVYRIRAYDTTYTIPRYYDHDTLVTYVLLQNPNDYSVTAHVYYWNGGTNPVTLLGPVSATLSPLTLTLIPPTEPPGIAGTAGHVVVTSDAGYAELAGKSSQFDTAVGVPQSWDWQMQPRP